MKRANSRSRFRFTGPKWQNCHNVCVMMWCLQDVPRSVLLARFVPCVVMNSKPKRCKCRHCGELFTADYRNHCRQHYCSNPECRHVSKAASQRRWSRKAENLDYFRGTAATRRVRQWREQHPGYWKKKTPMPNGNQATGPQPVKLDQESCNASGGNMGTLQDICLAQTPLFVGVLSVITGSTLQDDILTTVGDLIIRGRKILGLALPAKRDSRIVPNHDQQTFDTAVSAAEIPRRT